MPTPDRRLLTGCAMLTTTVLAACAPHPVPTGHPTPTSTVSPDGAASPDIEALLPVSRADLTTAIWRSTQTAATYLTYRYDESPRAYLARLQPLVTPELYAALARAAATPGVRAQRTRDHEIATARAIPIKLRMIGPASVVLLTTAVRDITTTTGHRRQADQLAVTATKSIDGTWGVADIEPAAAGDDGDTSDADTP